ncbi:nucleoid-associated protein [Catenovulum sp. 2E275]|uniref:nucleoid-associated protein n=1 Tax=Catenovulum sp. 2E275 TaxID=2980497 RepID=UPI0021D0D502|nr:nucleoid-associated protein [Catenovulum sp. 2E275]MCU4674296.1 nucleoid-associated protein [Catenovulum sp. 2E275]
MANITVIAGVSIPYTQDAETKKWNSTTGSSWDVSNSFVKAFAREANRKIKRRSKNHGKIPYPFSSKSLAASLKSYLESDKEFSFTDFVNEMGTSNNLTLTTSRAQSKLVLIFLEYEIDALETQPIRNLIVVLLKDKSALQFNDDGTPNGTEIIDFDDLMQAALIDMDEFQTSVSEENDIDISFINGASGTTNYFIEFFDASGVIKNKESVSNLLKALGDFSNKHSLTRKQRELCERNVKSHIEKNESKKAVTKLNDISQVIYQALRYEKDLDIGKDSFEDYIQDYNYKINEEFTVSKKERDTLEFISFETEVGNLKLKKSIIGKQNLSNKIMFNKNDKTLTIKTKINDPDLIEVLSSLQNSQ